MMKRILSFLLAFLMVVSIFPAPAYATDSTDVTITPTETPTEEATEIATETACPTCGTVGCTSEHLTWCPECKVDDCGKTHVFCEICQKNDCGQNHCPTCGTIDCIKEHKECDKCGTMDCTADHTNWCNICKADNCGKTHVYCETCQKYDCGENHNATEPTEAETELQPTVYELLMAAETVEELYALLYEQEYIYDLESMSTEELEALDNHADQIYSPETDDAELYEMIKDGIGSFTGTYDNDVNALEDVSVSVPTYSITTDTTWNLTGDVTLTGRIEIQNGATLTITGNGTIYGENDADGDKIDMFGLLGNGATLILGDESSNITLDGNGKVMSGIYAKNGVTTSAVVTNTTIQECTEGAIFVQQGATANITLNNCTITDCTGMAGIIVNSGANKANATLTINDSVITNCSAGAVDIRDGDVTLSISNSTIDNCTAVDGSAVYFHGECEVNAEIKSSTISNCISTGEWGGAIRTTAGSGVKLLLEQCVFKGNKSTGEKGSGAAVYWNACGTVDGAVSHATIKDCQFLNNQAVNRGGAIYNEAFMSFETAASSGFTTTEATPGSIRGILIKGNQAAMGGGIHVESYENASNTHANYGAELSLVTGMYIIGNKAANGAGVAMYLGNNKMNDGVQFLVSCDGAVIQENQASVSGGAIYMERNFQKFPMEIKLNSGTITGNTAPNGGAISMVQTVESTATNKIYIGQTGANNDSLIIQNNTATNKGGAILVSNGDVVMYSGTVKQNTAVEGGAVGVTDGSFEISGGTIQNNTATNHGGAAYVSGGTFAMNGTGAELTQNNAINGGAVYLAGGDVVITTGSVTNNKATADGGAVFVNNGNIIVGIENCTDESLQHTAHPVVRNNEATFGGGLSADGGKITLYCCEIAENESSSQGTGSNIFMDGGDIYHDMDGAEVGTNDDHGIVSVGGNLTVESGGTQATVNIYYHSNTGVTSTEITWEGTAPEGYYLNLPYCPDSWIASNPNKTFVGWADAADGAVASAVRSRDDYWYIGKPIEIVGTNGSMNFYGVWAPQTNTITYQYTINGTTIQAVDSSVNLNGAPTSYAFSLDKGNLAIPEPTLIGYDFQGWYWCAEMSEISNWGKDSYDLSTAPIKPLSLSTEQSFGNLVMVASFKESIATITYTASEGGKVSLTGSENFAGQVTEKVPAKTGTASGAQAQADTGYHFVGWYLEQSQVSSTVGYTPQKNNDSIYVSATYTAKFEKNTYTITWKQDDGTIIDTTSVKYGELPSHTDPSKAATAEYTYTFAGWSPSVTTVTGDATYTATYTATKNKYAITWKDENGTTIDTTEVEYGVVPTHATPSKEATAEFTYTFGGWTPEVVAVTGDATYQATFTPVKRNYTITWINDDNSVIDTTSVAYGEVPTHADPSKAATVEYTYIFTGWSPEVVAVTGEASYKATYTAVKNKYTITWQNHDGTVLETDADVEYGTTPSYNGVTPTKEPKDQFTYTFAGWSPTVSTVTGDAVYMATFNPHENFYTVTWVNHDGTVLETDENVAWDTMPVYNGDTPEKAGNAEHSYSFAGWSPTVSKVNGHAKYTATFAESVNTYTVTWKNEDGTVLETDEDMVYGAMPSYDGETPEKAATAQYTYTFDGWDKEVVAVTGDVTYTAKYKETVNKYTVTFVDEDGTTILMAAAEYEYGTAAEDIVKPANPTKEATAEFTYTFAGWTPEIAEVTANVTYKAAYTSVTNQYTLSGEIDHGTVTDSVTVNYGTQAKITFTPAVGYKFHSWKVNDGADTLITTPAATWSYEDPQLTESKHVVVTMAPIEYTITYYLRDENLGEGITNPETYTVETDSFTLNNPTRAGYKFKGWAISDTATTGDMTVTIEKGTTGDKTFYAIWERSLVDLTITATTADSEQSFIFTVSGTRSDGVAFAPIDVVLCSENNFQVTIKDLPVGVYTVTEKDGWSWREDSVEPKRADLSTESQIVPFDFDVVDDLHWLSGYSYKRKKGGS